MALTSRTRSQLTPQAEVASICLFKIGRRAKGMHKVIGATDLSMANC